MKKTKLVALTLVAAIMMMGAGYAYWSETLVIDNTVNTGELDVIFVEPSNVVKEGVYQPNADATPDGHGMQVTYNDIYPGVKNEFHFTLDNEGTIGAYVDDFEITSSDTTKWPNKLKDVVLCDSFKVGNRSLVYMAPGSSLETALGELNKLNGNKGIFVEADDGLGSDIDKVKVTLNLRFDEAATEEDLPELDSFGFVIKANVHQFNGR